MAKKITAENLNNYNVAQLKAYINRTAKKANLDLRALEKAGVQSGSRAYKYVETVAFDAKKQKRGKESGAIAVNKKGQAYFKTNFTGKETRAQLLKRAAQISAFKKAKTHTVAGVEKAYEKSYQTYINKKARELAEEKKGMGKATKADIMAAKRKLQSSSGASAFNQAWGSFNSEQYARAKRQSEQVAELILNGYTADEIISALDAVGEDQSLDEYREWLSGGEDINPFME